MIRLLLVEDDAADARLVQLALEGCAPGKFALVRAERLEQALALLADETFDIALFDPGLPDSSGLATVQALAAAAPMLPLVVLTGSHDEELARSVIQHGAQDYLVKGETSGPLIARTLHFALERKHLETRLRVANEALEQRVRQRTRALELANRELESFSYSVSHDLRAPLRAIMGFGQLLEQQCLSALSEPCRGYVARMRAGCDKMSHLIDDLLKLSRLSRQQMQCGPVDLSAQVRVAAELLSGAEPARRVEWAIAPGISAHGDAGLLGVVLENLIGNAWKYSSKRELARVEFGVVELRARPAYFVRDNGAGFDMAYADKLFTAFQRLHAASDFPGTGIGLATVARIVHRHGGEVWAESEPGAGATFYFTLADPAAGDAAGEPARSSP